MRIKFKILAPAFPNVTYRLFLDEQSPCEIQNNGKEIFYIFETEIGERIFIPYSLFSYVFCLINLIKQYKNDFFM